MMSFTTLLTVNDLLALPDGGERFELVRGELRPMNPTRLRHLVIRHRFEIQLGLFVRGHDHGYAGGEGGFILFEEPATVLAPDVAFFAKERITDDADFDDFARFPPDLAVDVLLPSISASETADRVLLYLEAGVRLVWIADPPRGIVVVHWPDRTSRTFVVGETLDGGDVLPGFTLPVADIFA
jgi:Uma2 family endonuclease